jgi:replicative DNA helicase
MDTDGWCKKGVGTFYSTTYELAKDTYDLAIGLGCKAQLRQKRATLYGKDCGICYMVSIRAPFNIFRLPRKSNDFVINKEQYWSIASIEPVESVPVKCIMVDSPDHLYLAGKGLIPTHNTWFVDQDALETAISGIPVYIWSGELGRKQITRRLYQLLGVDSRRMRSGNMRQEDWEILLKAKETLKSIPLYIDDTPMSLGEIRGVLSKEKASHDIQQVILDYSLLISNAGINEIERSGNVSREMKTVCHELLLSGILIASVNKLGMDTAGEAVTKSNIRGSGQQIHDCDNLYILTKFTPNDNDPDDIYIKPDRYDSIVSLHIAAGRDLDYRLPGGFINYERIEGTPKFKELKDVSQKPAWTEKAADKMNEREDLK